MKVTVDRTKRKWILWHSSKTAVEVEILLEKVAITHSLPLKAARRDVIANLKFLGPLRHHLHSLCEATLFGSHRNHSRRLQ